MFWGMDKMVEYTFEKGLDTCIEGSKKFHLARTGETICLFSVFKQEHDCPYLNRNLVRAYGNEPASCGSKPIEYFGCNYQRKIEN